MTDHQRADSIGTLQAGHEVTPNLNALAHRGATFRRAYNTCPLCVPARTALATGRYPAANGVVTNDWRGATAGDHKPIHQCLAEAGYNVAHIGVDHIRVKPALRDRVAFAEWIDNGDHDAYLEDRGLDSGFGDRRRFQRTVTENQGGQRTPVRYSNTATDVWPHDAKHFKDTFFARKATDFLRRPHDRPFALFLYLWAPHPPLSLPEPYASMFDPERIELPPNVGMPAQDEPPGRRDGIAAQLAEGVPIEQWRRVWAAHLGLVRMADDALGDILGTVDETGHSRDTLTVFTSDHGDHLGQHRMYQKMEMYEQAIDVPLLIAGSGVRQGAVFSTPVSHLDLMPTLLNAAGIAHPRGLHGVSLWPALTSDEALPERPVFSQYSGNPVIGDIRQAIITQQFKYIHDPADRPEVFDLDSDPLEMRNLADDPRFREIRKDLHRQLIEWQHATECNDPLR